MLWTPSSPSSSSSIGASCPIGQGYGPVRALLEAIQIVSEIEDGVHELLIEWERERIARLRVVQQVVGRGLSYGRDKVDVRTEAVVSAERVASLRP